MSSTTASSKMDSETFDWANNTWEVIDSVFKNPDELINHQLESYNNLVNVLIPSLMQQNMPIMAYSNTATITDERSRESIATANQFTFKILKVGVSKPVQYVGRQFRPMLPSEARYRNLSYSAPIYVDFEVQIKQGETVTSHIEEKVPIGKIPVMIGSKYCHLYGRSDAERIAMGECPKDRGGYFIVNGSEKVIISQERPIENNISCFEETDPSKPYVARVEVKSTVDQRFFPIKTSMVKLTKRGEISKKNPMIGQKLVVFLPYADKPIPLFIIFKALGVISDKEIMSYLTDGSDEEITSLLLPSAIEGNIAKSQIDALTIISNHLNFRRLDITEDARGTMKLKYTQDILTREFLPHVGHNVTKKLRFLSLMVNNLLRCYFNKSLWSDRDKLTNKRVDLPGPLISQIFRYWFQRLTKDIKQVFIKELQQPETTGEGTAVVQAVRRLMQKCIIENKINYAIATGNWFTNRSQANSMAKKGISQVLQRLSFLGALSHKRRVMSPLERAGSKHEPPRRYHGTQVPKICPSETPEGAQVGIVKNLSLLTHVSIETSTRPLLYALVELGMIDIKVATTHQVHSLTKVLINGDFVGVVPDEIVHRLYRVLKGMKLTDVISRYASIAWHTDFNQIIMYTDGGRYLTPYYTVNEDNRLDVASRKRSSGFAIESLTSKTGGIIPVIPVNASYDLPKQFDGMAVIEYLDTNEEETAMVASTPQELWSGQTLVEKNGNYTGNLTRGVLVPEGLKLPADITGLVKSALGDHGSQVQEVIFTAYKTRDITVTPVKGANKHLMTNLNRFIGADFICYTHCMLHPSMINGVVTSYIPFSHHNPSPRNNYQSSMGKQAIGTYVTNYHTRMDTISNIMVYPQVQTVSCRTNKYTGIDKMPHGYTSMHAIACFGGYNQEDSLLSNRDSAARGAFSVCFYRTYSNKLQKLPNNENAGERFAVPPKDNTIGRKVGGGAVDRYHAIVQTPGSKKPQLPAIGAIVGGNDIIIPKYRSAVTKKNKGDAEHIYTDVSTTVRATERGVVDMVMPSPELPYYEDEEGYQICKVRICEMRQEEIGDKFASCSAQKGTIGMYYDSADMIFNQDGTCPDKIMNAQAIPSRMTIGQLKDSLYSKAGLLQGKFYDSTPFTESDMSEINGVLPDLGYDGFGDEIMYNGQTGEMLDCPVFFNPTYYQRLKHMVADKIHARSSGPIQSLTRQPAEGRSRYGGLRVGEMERDCMIAHGVAAFLKEKLTDSSDIFEVFVSKQRQTIIAANPNMGIFQHGTKDIYGTDEIYKLHVPYALHLFRMELKTSMVDYNFEIA